MGFKERIIMTDKLTNRQKRFCEEYIQDLNGTQAAVRAGYSPKCAKVIAAENLTKPNVKKYIENLQLGITNRNQVTTDFLIKEFRSIAQDDIKNYLVFKKEKNKVKVYLRPDIEKVDTKNIQQISVYPSGEVKIKLYNRDNALDSLSRHIGFYNDRLTIESNVKQILEGVSGMLTEDHLKRIATLIFEQQKKFMNHGQ